MKPPSPSPPPASSSHSSTHTSVKLPTIELPKFDGSYRDWESFRDRFSALIISNSRLADSERLQYLTTTVSGIAFDAIKHLSITEANFAVAWSILTARFENKRRLIYNHVHDLLAIPTATAKSAQGIRKLRDTVNTIREALRKLGRDVDKWDDIVTYIVAERLDWKSKEAWEASISDTTDVPTYAQLDSFLQSRVRILESLYHLEDSTSPAKNTKGKASNVSSFATSASRPLCSVCNKSSHPLRFCDLFLESDVARRLEIVAQGAHCNNCLGTSHVTANCSSKNRCYFCGDNHHSLLHQEPAPIVKTHVTIKSFNSSTNPRSSPAPVLLATATVKVFAPCGRSASIRALLDQGSEATLISEHLAQLLRVPRVKQHTCVRGIGAGQSLSHHRTQIGIGPISADSPTHHTTALILKTLSTIKPQPLTVHPSWSHITGLPLADVSLGRTDSIDLLIGADLYGFVLGCGFCRAQLDQPVAQETIFGWILSGPVSSIRLPRTVTTHVTTLTTLDNDLCKVGELKEIPTDLPLSPQDHLCEEHFLKAHSRDPDDGCVVRLPFSTVPPESLDETRESALAHSTQSERRLRRESETEKAYHQFLSEDEALSRMQLVPSGIPSPSSGSYIPQHAVSREEHNATNTRAVFNASHSPPTGTSLTNYLSDDLKLQRDLLATIIQRKQLHHTSSADSSKMFRQVGSMDHHQHLAATHRHWIRTIRHELFPFDRAKLSAG